MQKIQFKKTFTKEDKEWFQLFGEVATKWFDTNCHWIPWKYRREAIDRAWHIVQKNGDHELSHFITEIKRS